MSGKKNSNLLVIGGLILGTGWLLTGASFTTLKDAVLPPIGCPYPPEGPAPLPKTHEELKARIIGRISEANRELGLKCGGKTYQECAHLIAEPLAFAKEWQIPVDIAAAIAWRESRFNPEVDNLADRIQNGLPMGPMQIRPIALQDVGIDPRPLIEAGQGSKIMTLTLAAIRYLDLLRSHYLVGASWCDLIHAYRLGPTAFKSGERASAYVSDVLAQAQRYSELRTE